ncbi:DNA/RNA helicase domain-containing protein [Bacillus sp. ISL-39]|uniref:DNA/RNA helicase domain-containing protein n=1 Tax=Bacillus sp. ISL-39 TaxID=2819124 RepID=UPI001BE6B028|nr:DNA/RNA helicase domain-containing protein [Bacillus sp. ISL-39]MBT2636586.1 ATP-binding protein [Bacillus sp. ISL-39]
MKPLNLLSLINAKKTLDLQVFELYKSNFEIKIKDSELEDLNSLVSNLIKILKEIYMFEGFYVGFTINQIGKEFDLLRFGENSIINIELKRENTGEKIKKQLIKNKYYLGFLGKRLLNFTYVSGEEQLYYLNEQEELVEADLAFLISELNEQKLSPIEDIDKLFNPSNYLVSPFNSTEAFLEDKYFLTEHQEIVKNNILKLNTETGPCFISLEGQAGTGKTLLTYDIAKEYRNNSKRVLIFHCGTLNDGHIKLRDDHSWEISGIKYHESYNLNKYDLIILDETQRIIKLQLEVFLQKVMKTNAKCIFSYDSQQCLASWEIKANIPQFITNEVSPNHFKLTEKIRTNKEIASFIKNLFDLSKRNPTQKYTNISLHYFSTPLGGKKYLDILKDEGWKIINYTPSRYTDYPYDRFQTYTEDSAHKVIGQEFDNVAAVIDEHFYYSKNGKLSTKGWQTTPYYHPTKMLFQMVTRARKKLNIIIINNEAVLRECLKILKE